MLESLEAFLASGFQVVVAVPGDGPLVAEIRKRGGKVLFRQSPVLRKNLFNPVGLLRLVARSVNALIVGTRLIRTIRPRAIYVSTLTIPMWVIVGRLNRVPVLCHVHEAEGTASPVLRSALVAPLRFATRVVANSKFSAEFLRRSSPRVAANTQVIYNGVIGPDSVTKRASSSGLRIMYVGRLSPRKGVDIVVNAVQRLRSQGIDASLDIVGAVFPGYEWYEAELRSLVDRNGTSDQVRFHGFQHEVWQFFDAADVVVVPSRVDEPFGNTAVEAALAARPAVVSQTSGLKEAAAGYSSVQFVEPDDLDAVVDALQRVVDARSDFFESAMADREIALDRHGLDRYRRSISSAVQAMNQSAR